jgi:hypothetical protein
MMNCPNCNCSDCYRDEVDIGVGVQYGPWHCPECAWYEGHAQEAAVDAMQEQAMTNVTMVPVRSSNIAELGYDEPASELHVRFLKADKTPSENVYIYPGVPKEVYQLLCRDDVPYNFSVGKEFDRHVKKVVDPKLVRKVQR